MFQSQSQNIKEHSVRIVSTAFLLFFLITSPVRAAINGRCCGRERRNDNGV